MRAAPLIEYNCGESLMNQSQIFQKNLKEEKPIIIGDPIRTISNFRGDILKTLETKRKSLFVKFEILTKATLKDALENGCRILFLKCIGPTDEEGFIVEDSLGRMEKLSFDDIKSIFELNETKLSNSFAFTPSVMLHRGFTFDLKMIDMLIIASSNANKIQNWFVELKAIPHIVSFNFNREELNYSFNFAHNLIIDKYIDKFTEFFCDGLTDNEAIRKAFDAAKESTIDFLAVNYFDGAETEIIKSIIGRGAILLPDDENHNEKLFDGNFQLLPGDIIDISKLQLLSNIYRPLLPITGRNLEIYDIIKKLIEFKYVEIYGPIGIGKTTLALNIGYFLSARHFYPDGIYYVPLGHLSKEGIDVKEYMKLLLGDKIEYNLVGSFKDKDMLFIFDDLDDEHKKSPYLKLFFSRLKECKISIIVVTRKKRKLSMENIDMNAPMIKIIKHELQLPQFRGFLRVEIPPLSNEEMVYMLLSYIDIKPAFIHKVYSEIINSPLITDCSGIPKKLIDAFLHQDMVLNDETVIKIKPNFKMYLSNENLLIQLVTHQIDGSPLSKINSITKQISTRPNQGGNNIMSNNVNNIKISLNSNKIQQNRLNEPKTRIRQHSLQPLEYFIKPLQSLLQKSSSSDPSAMLIHPKGATKTINSLIDSGGINDLNNNDDTKYKDDPAIALEETEEDYKTNEMKIPKENKNKKYKIFIKNDETEHQNDIIFSETKISYGNIPNDDPGSINNFNFETMEDDAFTYFGHYKMNEVRDSHIEDKNYK